MITAPETLWALLRHYARTDNPMDAPPDPASLGIAEEDEATTRAGVGGLLKRGAAP